MNTDKALTVILGIFTSVAIAFIFGALVQYISRLIFTFNYRKTAKYFIGLFVAWLLLPLSISCCSKA